MTTAVHDARRAYGPIANDISGLAATMGQIGGEGLCRWKMLMNGTHLEGPWNCVEYVVMEAGASIGQHRHTRTEEIYFIIAGEALMTVDGATFACAAGDLITAPIGTVHGIANASAAQVHFFVVEVFPGAGQAAPPARLHLPALAADGSVEVDLRPYFTGDWVRFRLVEIPVGGALDGLAANTEVIHVLAGAALVAVASRWEWPGGPGLSVALSAGTARRIGNTGAAPLRLIITDVEAA
jgi:quercetin dioxygenase-like cupin family protein